MKFRRDLIVVALATFCLTASIFMVVPTRSNPSGLGQYDPWIDNNEDGAIDIFDAIGLAGVYGTTGDPTKNVNVTNFPWMQPKSTVVWCGDWNLTSDPYPGLGIVGSLPFVYLGDYTRMSLFFKSLSSPTGPEQYDYDLINIEVSWWANTYSYALIPSETLWTTMCKVSPGNPEPVSVDSYPIRAPYAQFIARSVSMFSASDPPDVTWSFSVYAYLSYGDAAQSTRKTMDWYEYRTGNETSLYFSMQGCKGFSHVTFDIQSNVTWNMKLLFTVGPSLMYEESIGSYSNPPYPIWRSYELNGTQIPLIKFQNPSATPYYIYVGILVQA